MPTRENLVFLLCTWVPLGMKRQHRRFCLQFYLVRLEEPQVGL